MLPQEIDQLRNPESEKRHQRETAFIVFLQRCRDLFFFVLDVFFFVGTKDARQHEHAQRVTRAGYSVCDARDKATRYNIPFALVSNPAIDESRGLSAWVGFQGR